MELFSKEQSQEEYENITFVIATSLDKIVVETLDQIDLIHKKKVQKPMKDLFEEVEEKIGALRTTTDYKLLCNDKYQKNILPPILETLYKVRPTKWMKTCSLFLQDLEKIINKKG